MKTENKTTHTPGPWEYRKQAVSPTGTRNLCGVGPVEDGAVWFVAENVGEDDARLIAAAPELLAELRDILNGLDEAERMKFDGFHLRAGSKAHLRIRAAIAKAEGKK